MWWFPSCYVWSYQTCQNIIEAVYQFSALLTAFAQFCFTESNILLCCVSGLNCPWLEKHTWSKKIDGRNKEKQRRTHTSDNACPTLYLWECGAVMPPLGCYFCHCCISAHVFRKPPQRGATNMHSPYRSCNYNILRISPFQRGWSVHCR